MALEWSGLAAEALLTLDRSRNVPLRPAWGPVPAGEHPLRLDPRDLCRVVRGDGGR